MLHAQVSPIVDRVLQDMAPTAAKIAVVGPFAQQCPLISEVHFAVVPETRNDIFGDALDLLDATDFAMRLLEESSFLRINLTHVSGIYATHVRSGLPLVIHKIKDEEFDQFTRSAYPAITSGV